jgi:exonuclease III
MSEIMLNVRNATRAIHKTTQGTRIDYVVAALSADAETIEELQVAMSRFLSDHHRRAMLGE